MKAHARAIRASMRAVAGGALLLFLCVPLALFAAEAGYPVMRTFQPEDYDGGAQNFSFAQGLDGVMYVGNLKGLITYDGAWWKSLLMPNESAVFAVAVNSSGTVALSGYDQLGVLDTAPDGTTKYRSLVSQLRPEDREIGDVRAIHAIGPRFFAVGQKAVYVSDGGSLSLVAPLPNLKSPPRSFVAHGAVHLAFEKRLVRVEPSGALVDVLEASAPIEAGVVSATGEMLVAVAGRGLFRNAEGRLEPVAPEASAWLASRAVQSMLVLSDGRIAVATRVDGVLIVNREGKVEQLLDGRAGLPDGAFHTFFCDRDGGLWIGAAGAIQRVEVAAPVTVIDERNGLARLVEAVARHEGLLYAATERGVYRIAGDVAVGKAVATLVAGFNQRFWTLLSAEDQLLAGSSSGIYAIGRDQVPRLIEGTADVVAYRLTRSKRDPSRVWVGERNGVLTLENRNGRWSLGTRIAGIPRYVRSFEEIGDVLWCGTTFNGVIRYDMRTGEVRQVASGEMTVTQVDGRLVVAMERQPLKMLSPDERSLVPDPRFGAPGMDAFKATADAQGNLWVNGKPPRLFLRNSDGTYQREGTHVSAIGSAHVSNVFGERDGVVWLASDRGVFRVVQSMLTTPPAPRPLIRRVTSGERLIAAERGIATRPEMPHSFARLRFEFAAADYVPSAQYQFRLDPSEMEWSKPTSQPFTEFTNLSEGEYTFRVRTISATGRVGPETRWSFVVNPPWYRTTGAYGGATLALLLVIWSYVKMRTRNLRHRASALQATVNERTAELQKRVLELDDAQTELVRKNELLDAANRTLEALSLIDGLTSVANRRLFDKAFDEEWRRAWRGRTSLALLMIDLDRFKELNDRYGHPVGDDCLRASAALLRTAVRRSGDTVARYGGEEFAVLLPDTDLDGALLIAEQIRRGIEGLRFVNEAGEFSITASIGAAALVPADDNAALLIQSADDALYEAKRTGRNRVCHSVEPDRNDIAAAGA